MFWVLVTVFEISVALAFGFIVGRIYQIRCDELVGRDGGLRHHPSPAFRALDRFTARPSSVHRCRDACRPARLPSGIFLVCDRSYRQTAIRFVETKHD